jgi:hypothetical protein
MCKHGSRKQETTIPFVILSTEALSNKQKHFQWEVLHCLSIRRHRLSHNWTGAHKWCQNVQYIRMNSSSQSKMGPVILAALTAHHTPTIHHIMALCRLILHLLLTNTCHLGAHTSLQKKLGFTANQTAVSVSPACTHAHTHTHHENTS